MLAALQDDDNGSKLLDAARRLAGGLSDLLNAAQPENREVGTYTSRYHNNPKC